VPGTNTNGGELGKRENVPGVISTRRHREDRTVNKQSLPPHSPPAKLHHGEISWRLQPLPHVEAIDLLTLNADEMFQCAREFQRQLNTERSLRSVALGQLHDFREVAKRLKANNARLIEETCRLRELVMRLDHAA
jgi:hypothetical protein